MLRVLLSSTFRFYSRRGRRVDHGEWRFELQMSVRFWTLVSNKGFPYMVFS